MSFATLEWRGDRLVLLDQTLLPARVEYKECATAEEVADAIVSMVVRGAPAIGVSAAFGVVLAARAAARGTPDALHKRLAAACDLLRATRPTAVNLFWAVARMQRVAAATPERAPAAIAAALEAEALRMLAEDVAANRALGAHGAALLPDPCRVLTHCNAGALATAGYGTALGVVRAAAEAGKRVQVLADETRPFLQGSRLTAWELLQDGIDVTLLTDNMAGYRMARHGVDAVVVGADRIAANGDVANKIGTYSVAILARAHGVPFYVAAPTSTVDLALADGGAIPIEERDAAEVTHLQGVPVAPAAVRVWNPAFDVTPAAYVDAIVTEVGVARPPYRNSLAGLVALAGQNRPDTPR